MSGSFETESAGRNSTLKGREFEAAIKARLETLFSRVETHIELEGASGIRWKVDFMVDSTLIVEASTQRRLETKINSTFLRFVDITRRSPSLKAALVVEQLYVLFHKTRGKRYFPTSEYRTMLSFGFPIVSESDISRLSSFTSGEVSSMDVSSKPDFKARIFSAKRTKGLIILEALSKGPLARREIAKAVGISPYTVDDIMKQLTQVKKVSAYYGLSEDAIYEKLARKGGGGQVQRDLVNTWLEGRFLDMIDRKGVCHTTRFADEYGLKASGLTHLVHRLAENGLIQRVSKGTWERSSSQTKLE